MQQSAYSQTIISCHQSFFQHRNDEMRKPIEWRRRRIHKKLLFIGLLWSFFYLHFTVRICMCVFLSMSLWGRPDALKCIPIKIYYHISICCKNKNKICSLSLKWHNVAVCPLHWTTHGDFYLNIFSMIHS